MAADATYPTRVHKRHDGNLYVPSGAKVEVETGGDISVNGVSLIDEVAALSGLDSGELAVLEGAAVGTATARKVAIYDTAAKLRMKSATVAALGSTVADAVAMTAQFNAVAGATGGAAGGTGVLLPIAAADETVWVVNTDATNALKVYAITGSQINALGSTVAYLVTPGQSALFVGRSATLWYTAAATDTVTGLTSSATELNYNDITTLGTGAASKAVVLDAGEDYTWPATGVLTAGIIKPVGGIAAPGVTQTLKPSGQHTCDIAPTLSTDGTDTSNTNTEAYIGAISIAGNISTTGVSIFNGSAVAGNVKVYLFNSDGTAALAATASTAQSGTDAYQRIAWVGGPIALVGPATYYIAWTGDTTGATQKINQINFGEGPAWKETALTYGTLATITPVTTFTADRAPYATLY